MWVENSELDALSDYLLASEARSLVDSLEPNLAYAGITLNGSRLHGDAYWSTFAASVDQLLIMVTTARS